MSHGYALGKSHVARIAGARSVVSRFASFRLCNRKKANKKRANRQAESPLPRVFNFENSDSIDLTYIWLG
jgi:hypothetical protein